MLKNADARVRASHVLVKIALALLLVLLPVAALAATAALSDGLLPWHAVGGSSAEVSTGGSYSMAGAAGVPGGHQSVATRGAYSLNGGYVPIALDAGPVGPTTTFTWLPFVTKAHD